VGRFSIEPTQRLRVDKLAALYGMKLACQTLSGNGENKARRGDIRNSGHMDFLIDTRALAR
jgi:hypothetical protein